MDAQQRAVTAPGPGRLGDPARGPATDPRIHPRLLAAMASVGLDGVTPPPPVTRHDPPGALAAFIGAAEAGVEAFYDALPDDLPGDTDAVTHRTEAIGGPDGDAITLHVYRPAEDGGPLPGLIYVHGGGMTILRTDNKVHRRWCRELAATGMVVIGVDFRNAYHDGAFHPWPAGLEDCSAALRWVDAHRDDLGVASVVLQGESGGGNLVLATTLKAKRDGHLSAIDGVYAMVPYISGGYGWDDARKAAELPSLLENDGYFIECQMMDTLVATYDPTGEHATDPLAWPYHASADDLAGLPPHVISVNELDPLRDEGIAYFRKLVGAGVPAVGRVNLGIVHGADSMFRQALVEQYRSTVADIHRFAAGL
jgi:acetyl esterase/lipase